jgi:methyltransferase-like protein/ubiquinone/menaquinone biosynthesis C-methylase UbiE
MPASLESYDQVPYHSGPFRQTHPCHLAVLPVLFGLKPPPVRTARVLELGCASGGNLIPMAQDLSEGEFLGIDLSARQIAEGRGIVAELQLDNIELRHASILDVDASFGRFDYVLCHGVYSWVPRPVQDKILEIGAANLRPGGLCYVSYNTFPGWHLRGVVREMMRYHVAQFDDPQTRIDQARCLLDFLAQSQTPRSAAYRQLLADEAHILGRHSDSYLFHEHLEEVNEPLYFHEFAERAANAGLAYLGDADFSTMLADNFDAQTAAILRDAPFLRQEQYMDFLRSRMFRGSVLCHAGTAFNCNVPSTRLAGCHLALVVRLPLDGAPTADEVKVTLGHDTITASQPVTKAALAVLNQVWPTSLHFNQLFDQALERQAGGSPPAGDGDAALQRQILATDLMTLFSRGLLLALIDPPSLTTRPGPQPQTTPLVRLQARRGSIVTNRRHQSLQLSDLSRALVRRLDGTRNRSALADWLAGAVARGEFRVQREQQPLSEVDGRTLQTILEAALQSLAESALLVA